MMYLTTHLDEVLMSAVTVAELYAGARDNERRYLDDLISLFDVVPVSEDIAKKGGLFRQQYHMTHDVGLADVIIAATALSCDAELKTLNTN